MKTDIHVTLGMNASIGQLVVVLPQRNVRRERHLSREHREAISKGQCRYHDTKRFSITQPQWWAKQPSTFAKAVAEAMMEGQALRFQRVMEAAEALNCR